MENILTVKLIYVMREYLPKEEILASEMAKVLSLSEESVYDRLSGDVMFSFEETAKLSSHFGFSLDRIVGEGLRSDKDRPTHTDGNFYYSATGYAEQYTRKIAMYTDMLCEASKNPQGTLRIAAHYLPYNLLFAYKHLTLFRHYKKAYSLQDPDPKFRFSNFAANAPVEHQEEQFLKMCLAIPSQLLILNRGAFDSTIKDVGHFRQEGLLSDTEFRQLRKELLDLVAYVENVAQAGVLESGSEVSIYLSDVRMGAVYVHLESQDSEYALQYPYFIGVLNFNDQRDCQALKAWIDSLKGSSTLITKAGKMERILFFQKLRELIRTL